MEGDGCWRRRPGWLAGWLAGWLPKGQKGAFWAPKPLFGPKNDFWRQKCILARKNGKWAPKTQKRGKWSSKHQRNHCLEQGLRKGAKMTQKGAPKRKKITFWRTKPVFALKITFLRKSEKMSENAKRVEMGFKTPKKALSTEGFARWAQNEHLRSIKTPISAKFRTFAPKTRFGRFVKF